MSAIYEELKDLLLHEKGTALATVVRGPEHIGAKMLVHADKSTRGTLGIDTLNTLVVADAEQAIWNGDAGTHTYTVESAVGALAFDVFIEGFPPPPTLIIVGAGKPSINTSNASAPTG